ncbi:MAG: redoxin domain-containing protein [Anaerolineae bacterium]|jgi:peroxiredoxin|nr:redoxin domain-containing protein [Anaerolineae bacterium]MBT3712504.1 redoxin domain-containing protein [Anaerolineae bacterium]MBT4310958.1 redoxin domain-containing protein [Anaerolineae bacterium]MBT4458428.1 redoxin domain-containing protein [Anaerolineae bacterium]MBT4843780.1 redoxin domain-containing protein [Anaerolineae bacterium]
MPPLKLGKIAPNFTLRSVEGEEISLSDLTQSNQKVLLIFLRHLG